MDLLPGLQLLMLQAKLWMYYILNTKYMYYILNATPDQWQTQITILSA